VARTCSPNRALNMLCIFYFGALHLIFNICLINNNGITAFFSFCSTLFYLA